MARVVVVKIALPEFDAEEIEAEIARRDELADEMEITMDMHEKQRIAALCGFDDVSCQVTGIAYCECDIEVPHPPALFGHMGVILDARFEDRREFDEPDDCDTEDEHN